MQGVDVGNKSRQLAKTSPGGGVANHVWAWIKKCSTSVASLACACAMGALAASAAAAPVEPAVRADDCFEASAARYGLNPNLLRAVASAESDMRANAMNTSHQARTGTVDVGLMQINTSWLPTLKRFGIAERDLLQPCTNVDVGAWILANEIARHGNAWNAVGAYNAACNGVSAQTCQRVRSTYAWRVYRRLAQVKPEATGHSDPRSRAPGFVPTAQPMSPSLGLQLVSLRADNKGEQP